MNTIEDGYRIGETPAKTLRRLELTVMWLWSDEPVCDISERPALLTRLGAASELVERLAFRHDVHPDEPTDVAVLAECAAELDRLVTRWPQLPPNASTPIADLAA
ncbi:MAG: hypothetical protein AB8G14_18760 [Ilumatobacter sp.]